MATLYGKNADKVNDGLGVKIDKGETNGRVRVLYDSYTFDGELTAVAPDLIKLGALLPAGARVIGGMFKAPASGATGQVSVGYAANGVDVADPDGFVTTKDPGAAAVLAPVDGAAVGKKFTVATQVEATIVEATASADGDTWEMWLLYVVD